MWFPSSNNVSVIYERPTAIPAQPPQHCTTSSPYHNKLAPKSALTHRGLHGGAFYSMRMCVTARSMCARFIKSFLCMLECVCEHVPKLTIWWGLDVRVSLLVWIVWLSWLFYRKNREMISRVEGCLDTTQGEGVREHHKWSRSFLWIKRCEAEILERDCTLPGVES